MAAGWSNSRENIIEKSRPLLERGEVVAHVVRATQGPNRWLGIVIGFVIAFPLAGLLHTPFLAFALFILIFTSLYPRRIILATDRGLVIIKAGRYRYTPRAILDRLDLETKIGPLKGFWRSTVLNDRRLYVVPRTYAEVLAADEDVDAA